MQLALNQRVGPVQRHHGADLGGRLGGASVTLVVAGVFSHERARPCPPATCGRRTTAGLSSWTALGASTSYTVVPASSTPGTVTVSWAVRDRPSYSTGSYSARAVFTIAAP